MKNRILVLALALTASLTARAQAPEASPTASPPATSGSGVVETIERACEKTLHRAQECCRRLAVGSSARAECFATSNRAAVRLAEGQEAAAEGDARAALTAFKEADSLARRAMAACPGAGSALDPHTVIRRLATRAQALAARIARARAGPPLAPSDTSLARRIAHAQELLESLRESLQMARTHLAAGQPARATSNLEQARRSATEASSLVLLKGP